MQEYRRLIKHATEALLIAGLDASPKKMGEAEVDYLHNELYCDLEPEPASRQRSIIGSYLKWHGNPLLEWINVPWPTDMRNGSTRWPRCASWTGRTGWSASSYIWSCSWGCAGWRCCG